MAELVEDQTPQPEGLMNTQVTEEEQTEEVLERPENIPEKFWDVKKGLRQDDLVKSYTELEKTLADKSPKIPTEYDFSYAKEFGLADMDDELRGEVTQAFQSAKLTDAQAKQVMALYSDQINKFTEQLQNAPRTDLQQEQSALQNTWKDKYADNINAVKQFAETLPKRMLEHPLVDTAEGIQFLQNIMMNNVQNPIVNTQTNQPSVVSIREQINEMRADDKMKLPQGDPVGEAHRQKLYTLYEELERVKQ